MKIFITGTDTNVGKTYVTDKLLTAFNELGCSTLGTKPIASGCFRRNNQLFNDDALILQRSSSIKVDYQAINPLIFEPPTAPHIAANLANFNLTKKSVVAAISQSFAIKADFHLIEGIGGWFVPLNHKELMSDVIKELEIPVLLIVGMKLGCLNHAILTVNAMKNQKINLIGWIANCIDPDMHSLEQNIQALKSWIAVPCLGVVSFQNRRIPR